MSAIVILMGVAGLAWGLVADRISAIWPAHEAPVDPREAPGDPDMAADPAHAAAPLPPRPVDWRTAIVAASGGAALAGVGLRFADPLHLALFGGWAAVLVLLLATDLDQRLLPDVLTLPLIPAAAVVGLLGWNPLVAGGMLAAGLAAVIFPAGLLLLSIPFGAGAIGMGDLKLLVSVGLTIGLLRAFTGIALGALLSGVVVLVLLGFRVIDRRSYIPYGPFLILGTLWAALVTGS